MYVVDVKLVKQSLVYTPQPQRITYRARCVDHSQRPMQGLGFASAKSGAAVLANTPPTQTATSSALKITET